MEQIIAKWIGIKNEVTTEDNREYQEKIIIKQIRSNNMKDVYEIETYGYMGGNLTTGQWAYSLSAAKKRAMQDTEYKSKDFKWAKETYI